MPATSVNRTTESKNRIDAREAHIGVIGMGYVGLPLALLFSEERFAITGFDIDRRKVDTLNQGGSYIVRIPGTEIQLAQKNGFSATSDYSKIAEMDVVIICVPTPLNEYHEPDLTYITDTVRKHCAASSRGAADYSGEHDLPRYYGRGCRAPFGSRQSVGAEGSAETRSPRAFMLLFRRSGKIPETTQSRGATFPRLWEAAGRRHLNWPRPSTRLSSTARFLYLRLRQRR